MSGASQPPYSNPPLLSSSGPPGACITPSRLTNAALTISLIGHLLGPIEVHILRRPMTLTAARPGTSQGQGHRQRQARGVRHRRRRLAVAARDARGGADPAIGWGLPRRVDVVGVE